MAATSVLACGGGEARWTDPAGTLIYLVASPGAPEILLMFSTVQANEWEKRKNSGRL